MSSMTPGAEVRPDRVMEMGFGFMASRSLLSAVELGLFSALAKSPMDAAALTRSLNIHPRGARDLFDLLVGAQLLERDEQGVYRNSPEAAVFLVRSSPAYLGGMLQMAATRLYRFWGSLTEALRTGEPQNEVKDDPEIFQKLYADPDRLQGFLRAMTGLSKGSGLAIAQKFDWRPYKSFVDVGAAEGAVPVEVALTHKHLTGAGFDLPQVRPIFEEYAKQNGVADRVSFKAGDIFKDPLPRADVIIMGHILHDWGLERKVQLVRKAYEALPSGGAFIVHDCMIDDERRERLPGLLMSLNMLIETPDGYDYTAKECAGWMRDAGFKQMRNEHLAGADWMMVGIK